jgi:hypothetical protein
MTHEQIIEFIRGVSQSVNADGQFMYARENIASVHTYSGTFPLISLISARERKDETGKIKFWDLLIFFGDLDSLSSNPQEGMTDDPNHENQESIVNRMYDLSETFEEAIRDSTTPVVQLISMSGRRDDHRYMGDLTGWLATYTITTKKRC